MTILFIILGILIVVGIGAASIYYKVYGTFHQIYGDKTLKQVVDESDWEAQNTPRSVSNATALCLPRIQKDFPEFVWEEMRMKAMNVLKSTLLAINAHDLSRLPADANAELKKQVELILNDDANGGVRTYYDDITVHKAEIWKYIKRNGLCTIQLQAAAGYRMWKVKDGEVFYGSKEKLRQAKYLLEMSYVQDASKLNNEALAIYGMNCPNCGAPITALGAKHCTYCGAGIYEINIKVWKFGAVKDISA